MAENQENRSSEDLSEEPSAFRIEEMRKEGKVTQSREITGLVGLFFASITLYYFSTTMQSEILEFMRQCFRIDFISKLDFSRQALTMEVSHKILRFIFTMGFPVAIVGFLSGILGSFAQIGSVFSTAPLSPDPTRIDPIQGFKRLFSMRQVIEAFRLTLKGATLGFVAWGVLSRGFERNLSQVFTSSSSILSVFAQSGRDLFFSLFMVLLIFAGIDYWLQRREFMKSLRLTKQEAKQEQKEHEGDPQIKARIRSVQREMARKRMMEAVKKADVIVTNPTHIAIALKYDKDKMSAPKMLAKGADLIAQKMKKIAEEAGIPMVENVPLARALFKSVKVGQVIPRALYQAVAEVLAYVYRLKAQKNQGGNAP